MSEYSYVEFYDTDFGVESRPGDTITRQEYEASPESYEHLDLSGWFSKELTLNSNGTFNDYQTDVSFGINGTWSVENDTITLKIDGEDHLILSINSSDSLTYNQYTSYSLKFEKV